MNSAQAKYQLTVKLGANTTLHSVNTWQQFTKHNNHMPRSSTSSILRMVVVNYHQTLPSLARHGISFSFHNLHPQMGEDLKLIGLNFNLESSNSHVINIQNSFSFYNLYPQMGKDLKFIG